MKRGNVIFIMVNIVSTKIICNAYGGRLLELKSKWEESWLDLQCHVRGKAKYYTMYVVTIN